MTTTLDIVIPVLNEEANLAASVNTLRDFLSKYLEYYRWRVIVADNGSTDSTPEIGKNLAENDRRIGYVRLELKGRGRALSRAWRDSQADIVAYMDVDLSTGLTSLPDLVNAVRSNECDIAIGSRLKRGARVTGRSMGREILSRAYSVLFRLMFFTGFVDAQCGFKALSRRVVTEVVPLVHDTGWFFDSELLILAEKNGYLIKEIPVDWTDDPDSRVKIISTSYRDIVGLLRLRTGGLKEASLRLGMNREQNED